MRIAMTGTPIENDLTNLWSLFDFLNKGLMGTSKEFREYCKGLSEHPEGYGKLKLMISPFMLRRLKTDKTIIADLPQKIETLDYVTLSKKQVVLYRKIVSDMEEKLMESEEGIQRKGIVKRRGNEKRQNDADLTDHGKNTRKCNFFNKKLDMTRQQGKMCAVSRCSEIICRQNHILPFEIAPA